MKRNAIAMIRRCAKHQPDDAATARAKELEPVYSMESAPEPSTDFYPEVQLPEPEEEIIT